MTSKHEWVVEQIKVRPSDDILEIGCGGGIAASMICSRLGTGTLTAIDRSGTQVERATRRNREHVESGRARFLLSPLESLNLPEASFDKIFASDVNLFWTRPAREELQLIARLLRRGGRLLLLFEAFTAARAAEVEQTLVRQVEAAGLTAQPTRRGRRVALSATT